MTARIIILHERRTVPVVLPDDGNVAGPMSDGGRAVIVTWPIVSDSPGAAVNNLPGQGIPRTGSTELCPSDAGRMGEIVDFTVSNSAVAVGVHDGTVVPFPSRLFDRWDSAVAGIGGHPGVTDSQLRDVFLLMVAEMSGMTVPGRSRGSDYQNT